MRDFLIGFGLGIYWGGGIATFIGNWRDLPWYRALDKAVFWPMGALKALYAGWVNRRGGLWFGRKEPREALGPVSDEEMLKLMKKNRAYLDGEIKRREATEDA